MRQEIAWILLALLALCLGALIVWARYNSAERRYRRQQRRDRARYKDRMAQKAGEQNFGP